MAQGNAPLAFSVNAKWLVAASGVNHYFNAGVRPAAINF